jgi:hypothetical protein
MRLNICSGQGPNIATSPVVFSRMVVMVPLSESQAVDAAVPP